MNQILHNRPIRFAVIGLGRIGKRHAAMISMHPEAELVGLCDTMPPEDLGIDKFKAPFFSSIEALLESNINPDIVCIATPNGLHELHAIKSLNAGCHIVLEKPMALSKSSSENILHAALTHAVQIFCVMQNRYSPPSDWLKNVMDDGLLGKIFLVTTNCFWNRDHRYYSPGSWHGTIDMDGGPLFTQFSHFVDTLYWIFGDVKNIQARFFNFNHSDITEFEDSGLVNFDFLKGGAGVLNYSISVWNKNFESSITVIAEKGTIKIGGQYMDQVEYCNIEGYKMPDLPSTNPPNDYGGFKGSAANHYQVIDNAIFTLRGENNAKTNALEGLKVVEIIERIYQYRTIR